MALECATIGGAGCLGRVGEIGSLAVGATGDVAIWSLTGPQHAGAIADPIEAWLRCGPIAARDTIVHGTAIVRNGQLVSADVEQRLVDHRRISSRIQRLAM
jgi:cytosine/adenosine deaminase-related metal-dependent hydrolase